MQKTDGIGGDMTINEVVRKCPKAMAVFERHGMACASCMATQFETVRNGALIHGVDVDRILAELNEAVAGTG